MLSAETISKSPSLSISYNLKSTIFPAETVLLTKVEVVKLPEE